MEKDPIFTYRQPFVTAAGIILGFVLNYTVEIVKIAGKDQRIPYFILSFTFTGIVLLIVSVFRILNNRYNHDKAAGYYRKTLYFFLTGVVLVSLGAMLRVIRIVVFS